jgi:hypothetical protein
VNERERRIAQNEAVFREVNEQVRGLTETLSNATQAMSVVCECGTRSCTDQFLVRREAYGRVRDDPTLFLVKPGHDFPETETTIEKTDTYWVVHKHPALRKRSREQRTQRTNPILACSHSRVPAYLTRSRANPVPGAATISASTSGAPNAGNELEVQATRPSIVQSARSGSNDRSSIGRRQKVECLTARADAEAAASVPDMCPDGVRGEHQQLSNLHRVESSRVEA